MTTRLNVRGDGMHAYSDQNQVQQWEVTQWLIEYVDDNNNCNDASWSDWSDPDHIIGTYQPAVGEESGELQNYMPDSMEEKLHPISIGERGRQVLAACIAGKDSEELMSQWSDEIWEEGASPSP